MSNISPCSGQTQRLAKMSCVVEILFVPKICKNLCNEKSNSSSSIGQVARQIIQEALKFVPKARRRNF